MASNTAAVLALVFNALVFGLSWWPFRQLQELGLHPLWATALVFAVASALLVWARPQALLGFAQSRWLWLLMLASGITNVGFNWSVTVGDVVRAVLLFYMMPAWSVLLAWPLLGERPAGARLLRLGLALAGVVAVLKTPATPWPVPSNLADWLALCAGFTFALTNILLKKLADAPQAEQTPEAARVLAMFGGGAAMATGVALLGHYIGVVPASSPQGLAWLPWALGLCVALLLGNLALQYGAARLSASATSVIMLTEILFASVSSAWMGAGEITQRTLLGGALILLASLLSVISSNGEGKPQPAP
jgi:drug/metabolite transporter (DMT)-like permease